VQLLDLLLPARCVVCGRDEEVLCASCLGGLRRIHGPMCARCGAPTAWPVSRCSECAGRRLSFATARAAVAYDEHTRLLVAAWKERGLRCLTGVMADLVAEVVRPLPVLALAPVPADRDRTLWRGQGSAEALTEALAERWRLPVLPLLRRARPTPRQRGLDRGARRQNVREAFGTAGPVPGKVGLVDDVYTTGATVLAASTELRRSGAREVHVVTFARAIRR
jgi:predicted amidophosphoribosyltransferase